MFGNGTSFLRRSTRFKTRSKPSLSPSSSLLLVASSSTNSSSGEGETSSSFDYDHIPPTNAYSQHYHQNYPFASTSSWIPPPLPSVNDPFSMTPSSVQYPCYADQLSSFYCTPDISNSYYNSNNQR
jgi:hypothetical protein